MNAVGDGSVDRRVLELLREVLPQADAQRELPPHLSLQRDLGVDSLALASVAFRFGEEFGIDLMQYVDEMGRVRTIGDLLAVAHTMLAE